MGGAVGNLIDRVRFQAVTDFLRFYVDRWEWPSFNVADSAISVGVVLLAWDIWRRPEPAPAQSRETRCIPNCSGSARSPCRATAS